MRQVHRLLSQAVVSLHVCMSMHVHVHGTLVLQNAVHLHVSWKQECYIYWYMYTVFCGVGRQCKQLYTCTCDTTRMHVYACTYMYNDYVHCNPYNNVHR